MPKFDYIIQNPPYSKSLHLDFLKTGYNMLSNTGKMVIIEPSTFYINLRKNGKAKNYDEIKNLIKNHVYKVTIENYNKEFNTGLYVPFAITYIDKEKTYDTINTNICGAQKNVNSLYDINLVGNYDLIWSILNKINCDKVKNHLYIPNKSDKKEENYYCKFAGIIGRGICADPRQSDVWYKNNLYSASYYWVLFDDRPPINISNEPLKSLKSGYTYNHPVYSEKIDNNLYGKQYELENYKFNCFNLKIIPFINILMYVDQNNNSLDYVPWLVDKKYTDEEIYKLFNFSKEEIELIENTIKRYNRYSPWFRRYMTGDTSIEINQKYPWLEKDAE